MPFSDLDILSEPISFVLSKVVGALDPREPRTVGVLDLGLDVDDEVEPLVRSFRGAVLLAQGSVLVMVVATPFEGVRCALELMERSRLRDRSARGALHDGPMSDRRSDLVEQVTRVATELGDLAASGQVLITSAVLDGVMHDDRVEAAFLETLRLGGQATPVYEVRAAPGSGRR